LTVEDQKGAMFQIGKFHKTFPSSTVVTGATSGIGRAYAEEVSK